MTRHRTRNYNPGFLSEPELIDAFCVRQLEFESVLDTLRGCTGPANQPQIVIGPRGSGKTTLLLRVAAEVRRDPALSSNFFPVLFAEESYEVSTAGEFWLECLSQLAEQVPVRAEDPDLRRTVEALRGETDDRSLADRCLGALLDFADRENKRLVLFVENLNMMFGEMADSDAGWRLRQVLQTEPRIVLIASATNRFAEMDHPEHAFYDMFRVCALRRLDTVECAVLWTRVSAREVEPRAIRSLEILTGGSPRLIAIVARFGAARSFRNLMAELLDLVDDHTEYFKSHLEALPPQERRVYLALADLWKPATTREIAERCRLSTNQCSAQLARLAERGVVDADGPARRKTYYLTERLYNIYYLLRRRRGKAPLVKALISFMQAVYLPSEFEAVIAQMRREMGDLEPPMRALYQTAFEELATENGPSNLGSAVTLFNRGLALSEEGQLDRALTVWADLVRRFGTSTEPAVTAIAAAAMRSEGTAFGTLKRPAEALAVSNDLLRRFGSSTDPRLIRPVAGALVNKGAALAELNQLEDALAAWEEVERRFATSEDPDLLESAAVALVNSAGALGRLSRRKEALRVLDEVVARFAESEHFGLLHQTAIALVNKGAVLRREGRLEDALAVSNEVVRRFGQTDDAGLREQVAKALVNQGGELVELGRSAEALVAWEDVVQRYGGSVEPALLESVGKALGNRALVLNALGRAEDAVAVCVEVVQRFGDSEAGALRERAARALVLKGALLGGLDHPEDALSAFDDVLRRTAGDPSEDLRQLHDLALVGKANVQLKACRYEDVLSTADLLLRDGRPRSFDVLWRAHAMRAEAAFLRGDSEASKRDIKRVLAIIADWDLPSNEALRAPMELSTWIEPEEMIRLIEGSPAKDLLLPLTTALKLELGEQPRVALEVQEVAADIRRNLKELRKQQPAPVS